jgi:hypothetical protein
MEKSSSINIKKSRNKVTESIIKTEREIKEEAIFQDINKVINGNG